MHKIAHKLARRIVRSLARFLKAPMLHRRQLLRIGWASFRVEDHMKMLRDEMETYVELVSRSIGLEIPQEYKVGVFINLERLFQQSELFTKFLLSEEVEAATVFLA